MDAASPIDSKSALAAPERILGAEDARAYRRYLEWSVGHGFKMAIVEVSTPRRRDELIAWTKEAFPPACVVEIDQAVRRPLQAFLEQACPSPNDTSVLVLTRLDEAEERIKLCARLNIQRDELARAFPLPWVLFVHPATALDLEMHAPDFIDFAAVRLREENGEGDAVEPMGGFSLDLRRGEMTLIAAAESASGSSLLGQALRAIELSRYDEAADLLASYDLHHPEDKSKDASRMRLEGLLFWSRGQPVEALSRFEEALQLCTQTGSTRLRASLLGDIARVRGERGELDEALALQQEALRVFEELGDNYSRTATLRSIARIRADKGELDEALALQQEALRVCEELGKRRERVLSLVEIARIRASRGALDESLALYEEALRIFEEFGDQRLRAATLTDIARILADKGELDAARGLQDEALQVFEELGDRRSRATTLTYIAHIRADKGEVDAALALYQEALRIFEELGDLVGIANAGWSISKIEVQHGHYDEALRHLEGAYGILTQIGQMDGICVVGMTLGLARLATGKTAEAIAILERSRDGFERLGQHQNAQAVQELLDKTRQDKP